MLKWDSNSDKSILILLLLFFLCGNIPDLCAQPGVPLRLLYPNGGETIVAGTTATIKWTGGERSAQDKYRLEYSTDGGDIWNPIAEVQRDTTYIWDVPSTAGANCRVRVTKTRGVAGSGDSVMMFRVPWIVPQSSPRVIECQYSRDGKKIACWQERYVGIWDSQSGQLLWWDSTDYVSTSGGVYSVRFDWNDRRMAVCGFGWTETNLPHTEIWDVVTGERLIYLPFYYGELPIHLVEVVHGQFFSGDPNRILLTGRGRSGVYDLTQKILVDSSLFGPFITASDINPDGSQVLLGSSGGGDLRSTATWEILHHFDQGVTGVEFSRGVEFGLFAGTAVKLMKLADYTTEYEIPTSLIAQIGGVAESEVNRGFATISDNANVILTRFLGQVWVWYVGDDRPRFKIYDPAVTLNSIAIGADLHPDGTQLFIAYRSGAVVLRSLKPYDDSDNSFTIGDTATSVKESVVVKTTAIVSRIVPNPARNEATIYFHQSQRKNIQVRIFDSIGREINQVSTEAGEALSLDLSSFPSGVYWIQVGTDSAREMRELIVGK